MALVPTDTCTLVEGGAHFVMPSYAIKMSIARNMACSMIFVGYIAVFHLKALHPFQLPLGITSSTQDSGKLLNQGSAYFLPISAG